MSALTGIETPYGKGIAVSMMERSALVQPNTSMSVDTFTLKWYRVMSKHAYRRPTFIWYWKRRLR